MSGKDVELHGRRLSSPYFLYIHVFSLSLFFFILPSSFPSPSSMEFPSCKRAR
jgi:hypothetical protein